MGFKESLHKNSLHFFDSSFMFFDLNLPKDLFYSLIVKSPMIPPPLRSPKVKKPEPRDHSPIKTEADELAEPRDFFVKEDTMSKSFCVKMREENEAGEKVLVVSQKMNVARPQLQPAINRKQEKLTFCREKAMEPELVKSHNVPIFSKKTNKIFDPVNSPDLPTFLKDAMPNGRKI